MHEDWYLSEHNTGYIFMGPPWGSNGTLRVERQGGEIKKNASGACERKSGKEGARGEVTGGEEVRVEKRKTGIWYRRHCFRSAPFSLPFSPRSPAPARNGVPPRPKTTPYDRGACHSSYFFISPLFLFPRSSTHRLQYYHLPLFQACSPTPSSAVSLPLFRSDRRRRGGTRPLIYTCTSDHNINFNDGRDENIRTPRYLWRLSRLPSAFSSYICGRINPLPLRTIF